MSTNDLHSKDAQELHNVVSELTEPTYVYQVYTLHGTFQHFTLSTAEKAQQKCEELFAKHPAKSFTYYAVEVL